MSIFSIQIFLYTRLQRNCCTHLTLVVQTAPVVPVSMHDGSCQGYGHLWQRCVLPSKSESIFATWHQAENKHRRTKTSLPSKHGESGFVLWVRDKGPASNPTTKCWTQRFNSRLFWHLPTRGCSSRLDGGHEARLSLTSPTWLYLTVDVFRGGHLYLDCAERGSVL